MKALIPLSMSFAAFVLFALIFACKFSALPDNSGPALISSSLGPWVFMLFLTMFVCALSLIYALFKWAISIWGHRSSVNAHGINR